MALRMYFEDFLCRQDIRTPPSHPPALSQVGGWHRHNEAAGYWYVTLGVSPLVGVSPFVEKAQAEAPARMLQHLSNSEQHLSQMQDLM
jgi:hypothetical protein